MDGLILVRKPLFVTSHDVVDRLRTLLSQQKIGHFGTLDPLASGLLLIAAGKATKLFPFYSKLDKTYEGRMRLGFSTDTYDSSGRQTSVETRNVPGQDALGEVLKQFEGDILQAPPPFSAKKHLGRPLYAFARRNKSVECRPFQVHIHFFRMKNYSPPYLDFEVKCSSGTYIRALAHDLGKLLGCGAHLTGLARIEIGEFLLRDAVTLEEIQNFVEVGNIEKFLRPLETLLPTFPRATLNDEGARLVRNGHSVSREHVAEPFSLPPPGLSSMGPDAAVRLFSPNEKLIALARVGSAPHLLAPFLVLS
jgi:tRNA pseudouridine55 synthase